MPASRPRPLAFPTLAAAALTLAAARPGDIKPCELLTPAQVATVLPKPQPGYVAADGLSLLKGVKSYQCSYINEAMNTLTVVVTVAEDDAAFEKIKPSKSKYEDDRPVAIGDQGWVYGEEDDLKVAAVKGRALINLELRAPGASGKTDAMVELARAVAKKV
jgi:hypothetical protein